MYSEKVPAGARIALSFVSVLLSIVLFFCVASAILIGDVRLVTSKDGLQTIISQSLFSAPRPQLRPAPLAGGIALSSANPAQDAIMDALYGMLEEQFGDDLPISPAAIDALIHDSSLPDFISEKVAGIVNDIYTGNSTTTITKEEVMGLITENKALIENALGITLNDEIIDAVGNWVEETDVTATIQKQVAEIAGTANSDNAETAGFASALTTLRELTSVTVLLSVIGACILLMGLLVLTHWGRPFAAMRTAGIPIMLAGLLLSLPLALSNLLASLIPVVGKFISAILTMTGYVSASVFVLGLGMIIAGAILNNRFRKLYRAKLAAAAAVVEEAPAATEEAPAEEVKEEAPAAE